MQSFPVVILKVLAQVAELADARASGARGGNPVEVRFLSWALGLTAGVVPKRKSAFRPMPSTFDPTRWFS